MDFDELTKKEQRAVVRLKKLARTWPKTLSLFSNSGTLEVHKGTSAEACDDTFVDYIDIQNDGGDRD